MPKKCYFDQKNIRHVDHFDGALLSRFLTPWGKIKARSETGLCARHQRELSHAVKRARMLGLLAAQPRVR
jgi:small subunit ribosomal protein S18